MSSDDFGINRLRSGFHGRTLQRSGSHSGTPSESDDQEVDGGITLNVAEQGDYASPIIISDDEMTDHINKPSSDESELEEGEERESRSTTREAANTKEDSGLDEVTFVVDPTPGAKQQTCLKDLSPAQLESQIRYAFWQFSRDEIDLGQPARCLHCMEEGHVDEDCPQKTCSYCYVYNQHESVLCPSVKRCQRCRQPGHESCRSMKNTTIPCDVCSLLGHTEDACPMRHYTCKGFAAAEGLQLWISCCACASKLHLVGDCQEAPTAAPRWSLRTLEPNKVTNLNFQSGIEKRERDTESRDVRPDGMKIRGRATRHNADAARRDISDSDDDLENFFSHPPAQRDDRRSGPPGYRSDQYRPPTDRRYDRFDAPSDTYRPPRTQFYSTDSFGLPRSRSPPRSGQGPHSRPWPSSRSSSESYQPSGGNESHRYYAPDLESRISKRQRQNLPQPPPQSSGPGQGFQIKLPSRKGSNPNLRGGLPANLPPRPPAPGQPGSAKASNKKRAPTASLQDRITQPNQNKLQDAGSKKKVKNRNKKAKRAA